MTRMKDSRAYMIMENGLTIGDIVRLKSGGPDMTIASVNHEDIDCNDFTEDDDNQQVLEKDPNKIIHRVTVTTHWFDQKGKLFRDIFEPTTLEKQQTRKDEK